MKLINFPLVISPLLILVININAQITIDGTVIDTAMNPINNALVMIYEEEDKSNIYTTHTDEYGNFIIANIITDIDYNNKPLPNDHTILRNYPNPFNPSTIIYFEIGEAEHIVIKIYDLLGREVRSLYNNYHKSGAYNIHWDGKNNWNVPVTAGVYFCRLKTKNRFKVHKMVLLDGGSNISSPQKSQGQKFTQLKKSNIEEPFRFTINISEKNINPIEIKNIACTGDTSLALVATKPFEITIGAAGGEISTEEFYLNIPSGSLSENIELILYTIPEDNTSFEENVTNTYLLKGLTEEITTPLKIGLKYNSALANETVISFGRKRFIPEMNDSLIFYYPTAAKDSAGFLWSEYPVGKLNTYFYNAGLSKITGNKINPFYDKYIKGKTNKKLIETENFSGYLPEFMWHIPILNYLEIAWSKYKLMGFSFQPDNIPYIGKPFNVITGYFSNTGQDVNEGLFFGSGSAYIGTDAVDENKLIRNINVDFFWWIFLEEHPWHNRLQAISGILLFDALAHVYDKIEDRSFLNKSYDRYWFHKAVAYWTGELFTTEEDYIPPGFKGNELAPFRGIVVGASKDNDLKAKKHAYGMCSLFKYLLNRAEIYGNSNTFLFDVYSQIFENEHPVKALINNVNQPVEVWWLDYFREYISGNIYNVPSSVFLNAPQENLLKISIKDNTESSTIITREYPDLSAKLFRFDLDYTETSTLNQLQLKPEYSQFTEAFPSTLIFGLKDDKLDYLTGGVGTISCNIKEAQDNGYNTLLATVVNSFYNPISFDNDSQINLSIKTKEKDSLNFSIVKIKARGTYEYNDTTTNEGIYLYNPGSGDARYGTFENGIFESQWLETFGGGSSKGFIQLIVDLTSFPPNLISYYVKETEISSDIEINIIEGKNVNIPGFRRSIGGYEFSITGTETCSKITTLQNAYQGSGDYTWKLKEKSCDNDSYIRIVLGGK